MFKKLQRKILLLNMALISVVMLLAFATVYTITWRNMQLENRRILDAQMPSDVSFMFSTSYTPPDSGLAEGFSTESYTETYNLENSSMGSGFMSIRQVSLDYSLSFSLEIDDDGNILTIGSIIDMPSEAYETAVRRALAQNSDDGTITLDGKDWMYRIRHPHREREQFFGSQMIDAEIRIIDATQRNRAISFLDVTESYLTLRNLLITLSAVGIGVLVVFYFISLFFSKRAVKPVAEAWEKQKRFVADASHEFKTPLTIISANCDALLENANETVGSQRKWIDYMQAGTDRMTRLAGQLLTLAKMDDAASAASLGEVDMSKLILDTIRSMETMAGKRGLTVTHSAPPDVIIRSDGEKIATVVMILLENAVKYADSQVEVILEREKRHVCFTVKNDGKGIGGEDLPKVFDRFYRGDKAREGDYSHGLGLSIAKAIADSMNWEIIALSEPDGYTVFTVTLPVPCRKSGL